ncbi:MAG: winged helix DNA-binding protein [Lachnospiraceae bacterium]|nr:winged helix DNA-binding protein [Lachnospiraceae bacterium]
MSMSGDAREYLEKLYSCMPKLFYSEIEATQRGFGFVLSYLEQADEEVYAGDLSKKLNVSTARIAALLKKMEQNGLIMRCTSPKDARRTVVGITPAGIASVDEMRSQALHRIELLLTQVSKEDLETYIRISQKIKEVMDK